MDPPGINNTERDKFKLEYVDQNGGIHNFQSHKNQLCIPTDLTNIHCGNSSRDTTTTISMLIDNKSCDKTDNSRETTTTVPTHPTNKSADTAITTTMISTK